MKHSAMVKFGMTAQTCIVAASPASVLLLLCGAIATAWGCAMTAMSIRAEMPPMAQMSGLRMSAARLSSTWAKASLV